MTDQIEANQPEPAPPDAPPDAPKKPEPPPGQCQSCFARVKRADIEHLPDRPPTHRVRRSRHDLAGDVCGPVATGWIYHLVIVGADGRPHRERRAIPVPIEQDGALDVLEHRLSVAKGEAVEVLDWKHLGFMFEPGNEGTPS